MSKIEINNAIVCLSKHADQAKVHIIKKLTRNVSNLRKRKGSEEQIAKQQKKAEKIVQEILSIKKAKKMQITKFLLSNTQSLEEVLQNPKSKPLKRIMMRIGNHKIFKTKIEDFKKQYPNYLECLNSKKKIKSKSDVKDKEKDTQKVIAVSSKILESEDNETVVENDDDSSSDFNSSSAEMNDEEIVNENKNLSKSVKLKEVKDANVENKKSQINIEIEMTQNKVKKQTTKLIDKRKKINEEEDSLEVKPLSSKVLKKKNDAPKVISSQAIVKKFNDILENETSLINKDTEKHITLHHSNTKVEKEVDLFFMTEDGESNYLSVAVPKIPVQEDNDDIFANKFNKRKFSQKQNDNFFSKVDKPKKNNYLKFNSSKSSSNWNSDCDRNGKRYRNDKSERIPNSNKYNNDQKGIKSKLTNRQLNLKHKEESKEILHPSWEAKKKQQEILKQGFQGKKIVFGDDM